MHRIHYYIYTLFALLTLAACEEDGTVSTPTYTVGEADNAIVLTAGIADGVGEETRSAGYAVIDEANHAKHLAFTPGTKAALRVDGTWAGMADAAETSKGSIIKRSISSQIVTQTTTATIGDETETDSKHNAVNFANTTYDSAEQLYWDDYGTADPSNASGRAAGLSIYGAAINGETTAPTISNWEAQPWSIDPSTTNTTNTVDQTGTNYWKKQDLLITNNVQPKNVENDLGPDETYKFEERSAGKLLEFRHAMSKVTIRLIADEGFPTASGIGQTTHKFEATPDVELTSNVAQATSVTEWAYTKGNVNIKTGAVSGQSEQKVIKMHAADQSDATYTAIYDALILPGSQFGAPTTTDGVTTYPIIARLNADGNIYYIDSQKIRTAITTTLGSGNEKEFRAQPGVNYVITARVKKTKIEVTAAIKDWIDVEAETAEPVINLSTAVGETTTAKEDGFTAFDFYLSDAAGADAATTYNKMATATGDKTDGETPWTFDPTLYWPNHSKHYYMRGVSPIVTDGDQSSKVENGLISVANGAYDASTFPSNLLVGAPVIAENTMCGNTEQGHTQVDMSSAGICAREAKICLTFDYMMSQVEVVLTTTDADKNDHVNLANAKVEIIDGYTQGTVDIHSKTVAVTGDPADYTLDVKPGEGNNNIRHSIVVPQPLSYGEGEAAKDLKFRITIYKDGSTTDIDDVYTATIKNIKVKKEGDTPYDPAQLITAWEPGKHYLYTLKMLKTEINITATLTDWVVVEAEEDVWF